MTSGDGGRVLVVEDDDAVRTAVDRGLGVHGFDVSSVSDAESAIAAVARRRPDLMIVDVGLPGMSGIELCTRLRGLDVDTPILILSARDQVGDRVAGLQAGADDYLVKPFSLDELAARLHALLRGPAASRSHVGTGRRDHCGSISIGGLPPSTTLGSNCRGVSSTCSPIFAANPGIVLSRIRLLEMVWGYDFDVETNVVDVFVGYLRRKLESAGAARLIDTVRGVGFVLRVG